MYSICTYVCISLSLLYICTIPILYIFASFEKERVWLSESLPHSRGSFQVALGPSPHCPVNGAESAANTEVWKCVVCQSALMFNQRSANQRKTTFRGSYVLSVCVIQKRSVECWIKPGKEYLLLLKAQKWGRSCDQREGCWTSCPWTQPDAASGTCQMPTGHWSQHKLTERNFISLLVRAN